MTDRTSIPELHATAVEAVEAGDVRRALELQAVIAEADPTVEQLLDQFETAVEERAVSRARTLTQKLADQLADRRTRQTETLQRVTHARNQPDISEEEARQIQEYVRSLTATSLRRGTFLTTAASLLDRLESRSESEVSTGLDTASQLRSSEETTAETETTVSETTADRTLPANVQLLSVSTPDLGLSVGQTAPVRLTVSNVGDETATGVAVTAAVDSGMSLDSATRQIGSLSGRETATVSFEVTASEPGSHTVSFDLSSASAGSGHREYTVRVRPSPTGPVESIAGENRTVEFREVLVAISLYNQDDPVPGTDGATLTFQDVLRVIALYNEGESA
jgi:uncharacterized repeat protein (TIGR01451 family)